jgi:peptidylprolyl isomerase
MEFEYAMKHTFLILLIAASAAASAQTPAQPAATPAQPAATAAAPAKTAVKPATPAKPAAEPAKTAPTAAKLPFGVPALGIPAVKTVKKTLYTVALRYQEIKVGDGAPVEAKKLLKFNFTLWAAADGHKIDSTDDHPTQLLDKDRKPVLDAEGKPKMAPQPALSIMGQGRLLPGWEMGFEGMKAGGKRRVFIPWQLGLGEREMPARDASHSAIPGKSDLIIDLDLVEVADAPPPAQRPGMMPGMRPPMGAHPMPGAPGMPPVPVPPGAPARPPAPGAPAAPVAPAAPATPAQPPVPAPPAAPATPAQPQSK